MNNLLSGLTLAGLLLFFSQFTTQIAAQDLDDVSIRGVVVDPDGAGVPNAKVTAALSSRGIERTLTANASGMFHFVQLPPGIYSIQADAQGFASKNVTGLKAFSGQSVELTLVVLPAAMVVEKDVSVSEDRYTIRTEGAVESSTITDSELRDLSSTSQDVLDLIYMLAETAEEPLSIRDLAEEDRIGGGSERDRPARILGAGTVSLAGGVSYSTNFTIDGLDNNDDREAELRVQPPIDSIAEIQVVSNQFSAEYGRASGGRINIRTRAGTRHFRGRFSASYDDAGFNANTYNNNRRGLAKLPFRQVYPSFSVSGPIPKSPFAGKSYFLASYSLRLRKANTRIRSVVPLNRNPRFPISAPTDPNSARPDVDEPSSPLIANYRRSVSTPVNNHRWIGRVDHFFSNLHNLTLSYQGGRSKGFRQYRETTRFLEETLLGRTRNSDAFYGTSNLVLSSRLVNQFRFQFSSLRPGFSSLNPTSPVVLLRIRDECLGDSGSGKYCPKLDLSDEDRINGTVVVGNSTTGNTNLRSERRVQFQNTLNIAGNVQNFRLGLDYQRISSSITQLGDATGTFNFDSVSDFLVNKPSRFRVRFGNESVIQNSYAAVFVQHDWKPNTRMMFASGVRYERETAIRDSDNLGPRLGMVYSFTNSGRSVLRMGAGIFFNRVLLRTLDDFVLGQRLQKFDSRVLDGPSDANCLRNPSDQSRKCLFLRWIANKFPTPPIETELRAAPGIESPEDGFVPANFTRRLGHRISVPESYQFRIGFERQLGAHLHIRTSLSINKAIRLWRERNINAHRVPTGFQDFTEFLLSLGEVEIPGISGGTDVYRFHLGDPTDPNGDQNSESGADCNSNTPLCLVNLNTTNGSGSALEPIGIALRVLDEKLNRPISNSLGQIEEVNSVGKSVYEGLTVQLIKRSGNIGYGLNAAFRLSYVLSRTRDDGVVDTSSAQRQGDFHSEFSPSGIDRRHKVRFAGTLVVPKWLGGLRISPLVRIESARPFNISIGGADRNLDDVGNDRPNYSGARNTIKWVHPNAAFPQQLAARFSLPPIGSIGGDLPRNAGRGPALMLFNLNVTRSFKLQEGLKLTVQTSIKNVPNHTVFSFGSDFINLSTAGTPEFERGFLVPSRTMGPRSIQVGLRIEF